MRIWHSCHWRKLCLRLVYDEAEVEDEGGELPAASLVLAPPPPRATLQGSFHTHTIDNAFLPYLHHPLFTVVAKDGPITAS